MPTTLSDLKKNVFFDLLDLTGRVFIVVRYSDNVVIGNRGFTEDERENGIVLVFNKKMGFSWDEDGISATLVFGTSPQQCFVPVEDILVIYSPELRTQFMTVPKAPAGGGKGGDGPGEKKEGTQTSESKVVRLDLHRKRGQKPKR